MNESANTSVERASDTELKVRRSFNGPAHLVFKAWTTPEIFRRWWVPASFGITLQSCEMDVRTGGSYTLAFANPEGPEPFVFHGRYIEVVPNERLVWTNEEEEDGAVTTVTFTETDGRTLVVMSDVYPSKEALEAAIASGSVSGYPEQFDALEDLLGTL